MLSVIDKIFRQKKTSQQTPFAIVAALTTPDHVHKEGDGSCTISVSEARQGFVNMKLFVTELDYKTQFLVDSGTNYAPTLRLTYAQRQNRTKTLSHTTYRKFLPDTPKKRYNPGTSFQGFIDEALRGFNYYEIRKYELVKFLPFMP